MEYLRIERGCLRSLVKHLLGNLRVERGCLRSLVKHLLGNLRAVG
jgi:hypothetical protein